MNTDQINRIKQLRLPGLVLLSGIGLGIAADLMLYARPPGISIPILVVLYIVLLLALVVIEGIEIVWANLWLIAPILLLAKMSAVRAAPLLRFLNIGGMLILLVLLAWGLASRPVIQLNVGGYIISGLESLLFGGLIMPGVLLIHAIKLARQGDRAWQKPSRRVATGVMLAAPFLVLFTVLFASADQIFAGMVNSALDAFNIGNIIGHSFYIALLSWLMFGGLAYTLTQRKHSYVFHTTEDDSETGAEGQPPQGSLLESTSTKLKGSLGNLEASVVLFSINALFALFVTIQFAALFGGEAFLQRQGLTYSEYARRGFFELLWVSIITLLLILSLDFLTERGSTAKRLIFLIGGGLMMIMTIVILGSAYHRMQLYEIAYGFTIWRVYPHIFMIWLAVLFAYFLVFLVLNKTRYMATGILICALGFVITMDVLNPDAFIVRQNIARYEHGEDLDVAYLGSLSADATPHLISLLYVYDGQFSDEIGPWLHLRLNHLDLRGYRSGWASYHAGYARAYRVLDINRELIESYDLPEYRGSAYTYP